MTLSFVDMGKIVREAGLGGKISFVHHKFGYFYLRCLLEDVE